MKITPLLRKAKLKDVDAIANVYLMSRKQLVNFAPIIHTDEIIHQWIRNDLLTNEQVIIAEIKGIIIGMMSLANDKKIGWIKQLYIHPDAVNQGIGTLMIKKAKSMLGSPIQLYTFQKK